MEAGGATDEGAASAPAAKAASVSVAATATGSTASPLGVESTPKTSGGTSASSHECVVAGLHVVRRDEYHSYGERGFRSLDPGPWFWAVLLAVPAAFLALLFGVVPLGRPESHAAAG